MGGTCPILPTAVTSDWNTAEDQVSYVPSPLRFIPSICCNLRFNPSCRDTDCRIATADSIFRVGHHIMPLGANIYSQTPQNGRKKGFCRPKPLIIACRQAHAEQSSFQSIDLG